MHNVSCRRALMQYLESRVTALLAGFLAYIDTNNNLDVLGCAVDNSVHWLRDMWFHMFSDDNITVLKYRSVFISPLFTVLLLLVMMMVVNDERWSNNQNSRIIWAVLIAVSQQSDTVPVTLI